MPIHATPASARPIQTPLPSSANSATTRSVVIRRPCGHRSRFIHDGALRPISSDAFPRPFEREFVDEGDQQDERADRHRELRNPQRRRVVPGRDVVELPRLQREPDAVEREQRREQSRHRQRPRVRARAARPARRARGSSVTRMCSPRFSVCASARKPARGHAVAGVRIGARNVEVQQAPGDADQHHRERPHQEQRRQIAGGVVQASRIPAHDAASHRAIGVDHLPAVVAGLAQPFGEHVVADLAQVRVSCSEGFAMFMPLPFSWSRYQPFFSSRDLPAARLGFGGGLQHRGLRRTCRARRTPSG